MRTPSEALGTDPTEGSCRVAGFSEDNFISKPGNNKPIIIYGQNLSAGCGELGLGSDDAESEQETASNAFQSPVK